jgi:hypothetical protein
MANTTQETKKNGISTCNDTKRNTKTSIDFNRNPSQSNISHATNTKNDVGIVKN